MLAGNSSSRRFPQVEEQVTERMVIRGTPGDCYAVLVNFERYPEWAADIKAVQVDERDGQGRALSVTFRAAAFGRSTSYTLRYDYSQAPEVLSWVQTEGDITRRLDGSYHLSAWNSGEEAAGGSGGTGGPVETGGPVDTGAGGAVVGSDRTEIEYRLIVDLKVPLPGFVKRRAEGRIMGTALRELKAVVEGSALSGT